MDRDGQIGIMPDASGQIANAHQVYMNTASLKGHLATRMRAGKKQDRS